MQFRSLAIASVALLVGACRVPPSGYRTLTGSIGPEGGVLATDWGVALSVPPGALASAVTFSIGEAHGVPEGAALAAEIGPSGTTFLIPATLRLTVPEGDAFPSRLKVMTVTDGRWTAIGGYAAQAQTREISASLEHLSPYGLVESDEQCANGTDDDGDGLSDCADPVCASLPACGGVTDGGHLDAGVGVDGGSVVTCHNDNQCPTGMVCSALICVDAPMDAGTVDGGSVITCHNNNQCPTGMVCDALICIDAPADAGSVDGGATLTCHNDNQCPIGMVCDALICIDAAVNADGGSLMICHNDNQCPTGMVCDALICIDAPDGGRATCASDADCQSGQTCRGHTCR